MESMLSHQHHHLMFDPNSTCGLNNGFLYLWPVLLVVMIETIKMIKIIKMGCGPQLVGLIMRSQERQLPVMCVGFTPVTDHCVWSQAHHA